MNNPAPINRMRAVLRSPYTPGMRTIVRAFTAGADPHARWKILVVSQVDLNDDGNTTAATEPDEVGEGHAWYTVYSRALTGYWARERALDAYQAAVADLLESGQQLVERREWVAEPEPEHDAAAQAAAELEHEPGPTMIRTGSNGGLKAMCPDQLVTDIDNRIWYVLGLPEGKAEHLGERDPGGYRLALVPVDLATLAPTGPCINPSQAQAEAAGSGTVRLWFHSDPSPDLFERISAMVHNSQ